jgi:hypothetical protein
MGQGEKTPGLTRGRKRISTKSKKAIARTQRGEVYVHVGKSKPAPYTSKRVTNAIKKNVEDIMKARLLHHGKKLAILPAPNAPIETLLGYSGPSYGKDAKMDRAQTGGARRAKELMEKADLTKRSKRKRVEENTKIIEVDEYVGEEEEKRYKEKEIRRQNVKKPKKKDNFYSNLKKGSKKGAVTKELTNSWSDDL